jgi:hypothetical protein
VAYNRESMTRVGVAVVLAASMAWAEEMPADAQRVLDLARAKVLHTTRSLPRYTCQETIQREYLSPVNLNPRIKETCDRPVQVELIRSSTDRIRLEVAVTEGREIDAWPGASRFDAQDVDELVTSGPISTGSFGTILTGIFDNPGTDIEFAGEKTVEGRRVFSYRYNVPFKASHYQVKLSGGMWWNTPYSGEFEIGADAAELARLTQNTGTLPVDSRMCRAETGIDYHYEKVGEGGFLIPQQARLRTTRPDGTATMSVTTFSACHEYMAESTIRFDDDDVPSRAGVREAAKAGAAFTGGLELILKLAAPIDTDTAAAGDAVVATVAKAVVNPKSNQVMAPAGIRVRGRIVTARHYLSADRGFDIGLEFDRYELNGVTAPFAAILLIGETRVGGAKVSLRPVYPAGFNAGGVMSLHTKSARVVLPAGTELKWMTMTPIKTK